MRRDWGGVGDTVLRVDGGMAASDWMMQRLADLIRAPVDRPSVLETTALGAAYLAGLQSGLCPEPREFRKKWVLERRFVPTMPEVERARKLAAWRRAVKRMLFRPSEPVAD
jgi:glycerol kinase